MTTVHAPQVPVSTRWRDTYAGDLVLGDDHEVWLVVAIAASRVGFQVNLARGGHRVNATVDPDDLVLVLHPDPANPHAGPRVVECPTCHGRGRVHGGAA